MLFSSSGLFMDWKLKTTGDCEEQSSEKKGDESRETLWCSTTSKLFFY